MPHHLSTYSTLHVTCTKLRTNVTSGFLEHTEDKGGEERIKMQDINPYSPKHDEAPAAVSVAEDASSAKRPEDRTNSAVYRRETRKKPFGG